MDFHQARLSISRLGDILNTTAESTYTVARTRLPAIRGDIKFDHVTFRYRIDGQEVLHDVTFDVPAGQMVGIVGPSGSGKSTFAKLVQRLYVPESGRVLVDGIDLAMADPAWLRRQIGVVLQENVLFNRSVRENIALADPAMPMERVIAARVSDLGEFDHRFSPEHRCRHWPSPRTKGLGTPNNPAIRFTRGTVFAATLVRCCYGLSGCWPPCTDLPGLPANGGFYFQAFDGSVALPVAGYDYNSVWTPCMGSLLSSGFKSGDFLSCLLS